MCHITLTWRLYSPTSMSGHGGDGDGDGDGDGVTAANGETAVWRRRINICKHDHVNEVSRYF